MATYYLDYELGSDSNDGSAFGAGTAWKTLTGGPTAARVSAGDTIKIAKSPDPVSIGDAVWKKDIGASAAGTLTSSTNATPVVVTAVAHGLNSNDFVYISGHSGNAINGVFKVAVLTTDTFQVLLPDGTNTVGTGAGTGGAVQLVNASTILLLTSQTLKIADCVANWSAMAGGDCTPAVTTTASEIKAFGKAVKFTLDSAVQTSKAQAFFATGTLDLSAYQQISLSFRNSVAIADNARLTISLCSNADGTGVVDVFKIPAIPTTTAFVPLTLTKEGGGNLGNSIKSILLSTGTSSPGNSTNFVISNVIACKTDGVNLQSIVSPSSAAQGGLVPYFPVWSISGDALTLAGSLTTPLNTSHDISGTIATYKRETIKYYTTAALNTLQKGGDMGNPIIFDHGYNTSTGAKDGETYVDCVSSSVSSNCFLLTGNIGNFTINNLGFVRTLALLRSSTSGSAILQGVTINNCNNVVSQGPFSGIIFKGVTINGYRHLNSGTNTALTAYDSNFDNIAFYSSLSTREVINSKFVNVYGYANLSTLTGSYIENLYCYANTIGGSSLLTFSANNGYIKNLIVDDPTYNSKIASSTKAYIKNLSITNDLTTIQTITGNFGDVRTFIENKNASAYRVAQGDGYKVITQASTLTNGSGNEYKMVLEAGRTINAIDGRNINFVGNYPIARIAVNANKLVTVKGWFKKSHATDIVAKLVCPGGYIAGVDTDEVATVANNTDEQELTITFTPTEAGVVDIKSVFYSAETAINYDVVFSDGGSDAVLGTKTSHGLSSGDVVNITGVTNAYGNDTWTVTRINDDTFTLDSASWLLFNGADVTGDVYRTANVIVDQLTISQAD
jgi:hypothetical protein